MGKYYHHSLSLSDEEQEQFLEVKKRTGAGVKKIFMTMIKSVLSSPVEVTPATPVIPSVVITEEE